MSKNELENEVGELTSEVSEVVVTNNNQTIKIAMGVGIAGAVIVLGYYGYKKYKAKKLANEENADIQTKNSKEKQK